MFQDHCQQDTNYDLLGKWKDHGAVADVCWFLPELRHCVSWLSLARCSDLAQFPFSVDRPHGVERIKQEGVCECLKHWGTSENGSPDSIPRSLYPPCTEFSLATALEVPLGTQRMLAAPLPHWGTTGLYEHHMMFSDGLLSQPMERLL